MLILDEVDSLPVILIFAHLFHFSVEKQITRKKFELRSWYFVHILRQTKPRGDGMDYRNNSPRKQFECRAQNSLECGFPVDNPTFSWLLAVWNPHRTIILDTTRKENNRLERESSISLRA